MKRVRSCRRAPPALGGALHAKAPPPDSNDSNDSNDFAIGTIIDKVKELDAMGYWPERVSKSLPVENLASLLKSTSTIGDDEAWTVDGASILHEVGALVEGENGTRALYEAFCRGAWEHLRRKYDASPDPRLDDDELAVLAHCVRCGHLVEDEHDPDERWGRMLRNISKHHRTPEQQAHNERRFIAFYATRPDAFSDVASEIASFVTAPIEDDTDPSDYDSADDSADDSDYYSADDSDGTDAPSQRNVSVFMEALVDADNSREALQDSLQRGSPVEMAASTVEHVEAESKLCSHAITQQLGVDANATNPMTLLGTIRATFGMCYRIFATVRDSRIVQLAKTVLRGCKSMLFACVTCAQYIPMLFESVVYGVYAFAMQYANLTAEALLWFTRIVRLVCGIGRQLPGRWKAVSSSVWFRMANATVTLPYRAVVALMRLLWSVGNPSTRLTDTKPGATKVQVQGPSPPSTARAPTEPPSSAKRCPGDFPMYCKTGLQSGWCVNDRRHCDMAWKTSEFTRKKPTDRGTGDVCTVLTRRRG